MSARQSVVRCRPTLESLLWAILFGALAASGCANFQLPRLDPSGEHVFVHPGSQPPPILGAAPVPIPSAPLAPPGVGQCGISISPSQVVAPVGSEVVMIASVIGIDGPLVPNQRVEWTLAPDGAGEFLSPGERRCYDLLNLARGLPKKIDSRYAINSTLFHPMTLDRGTPVPTDDVLVQSGQAWVTVTSPTEGTSRVTVFAPQVYGWDRRQQTASIYWVDAQWRFPPPAIAPVGSRHTITTFVSRQSDNTPLPGWQVRYEVVGGPGAGFSPDGAQSVEVLSNAAGEASAEIFQKDGVAGTNQVQIQVIRPAGIGGQNRPIAIGSGSTLQTWTSTELSIHVQGPPQAGVGTTVTYRLQVTNPADTVAQDVVVADQAPPGLVFVNSNPASEPGSAGQQWRLGDVAARGTSAIEANYRVAEAGDFSYCATVNSASGTSARDCIATRSGAAAVAQLEIAVMGPPSAVVGSDAQFDIQVTNRSATPATGLVVTDRYERGLQHAMYASPIEKDLGDLPPGTTTRLAVTLRITEPGELCQEIVVRGNGGVEASKRTCITATAASEPPSTEPESSGGIQPPSGTQPNPAQQPDTEPHTGRSVKLSVQINGQSRRALGETVRFTIDVTNPGPESIEEIVIANHFETSLQPEQATEGSSWIASALGWKIDSLAVGKTIRREIVFKSLREAPQACNRVTVTGRGIDAVTEEACAEIVGEQSETPGAEPAGQAAPISVSVAETADPVKVGGETTYQVLVENKSEQSQFDMALSATFGDELKLEGLSSPVEGRVRPTGVQFPALRELRAGETATFEFRMKAVRAATARFKVDVTSRGQKSVSAEQTTEILP